MADIDFFSKLPPEKPLAPGHPGANDDTSGLPVRRLNSLALATLIAGRGHEEVLGNGVRAAFGVDLPRGPRATLGAVTFVGTGPGRWLVVSEASDGATLEEKLAGAAGKAGSVCDQSDGLVVFELTGTHLRDVLAKMLPIDIHPRVFGAGSAATTAMALIGVTFWQLDDAPCYRFAVARSYETAFIRVLEARHSEHRFALDAL